MYVLLWLFLSMIQSYSWASRVAESVLEDVFRSLDVDGDGTITEAEFAAWFADFKRVRRT